MHDTSSILHGMRTHTRAHTHTTPAPPKKSGIALRASALLSASALGLRATERKSGIALRASALLSASALGLRATGVGRVVTISDHTPHLTL